MTSDLRPASPQSLASIDSYSTQTSTIYRVPVVDDAASAHSMHTLFHDAAELPVTERQLRVRSHYNDSFDTTVAAQQLGAMTETTSLLARPMHPAHARQLQEQREGIRDGAIVGTAMTLFVAAQMVNRSDDARPKGPIASWVVWGLSRPALFVLEPGVRNITVPIRDTIGGLFPATMWLARMPDKIADGLAFFGARSQSGSTDFELALLRRFPGTPYPLECLGEVQAPDCPDLFGYQLASQIAPYVYGINGMVWGGVAGASLGLLVGKPFIKDFLQPALRKVSRLGMQGAHQVATSMVSRPPRSIADLVNLAIENSSRFLGRFGQYVTTRASEAIDESSEVEVSHPA